jgi:flagellar biosynthesis/type III secretory pathway protein FliH
VLGRGCLVCEKLRAPNWKNERRKEGRKDARKEGREEGRKTTEECNELVHGYTLIKYVSLV